MHRSLRRSARLTILAVIAASIAATASPAVALAPLSIPGEPIPGSYIVTLHDHITDIDTAASSIARRYGGEVDHVYDHVLGGFALSIDEGAVRALRRDARVAYVEQDTVMHLVATQNNPAWGLDRIDERDLPLDGVYEYTPTGAGVTAYIIDTGVRITHDEFGNRARHGRDEVDNDNDSSDCHGHGTHVAGTVGGTTYGVAKGVDIVGVRVLDCAGSGSNSDVIAGVNWVTADHDPGEPAVANMSLGGGSSSSLDNAVRNSIADGVTYALAAGNGNILGMAVDACGTSPARTAEAITVSATDSSDRKASWANYGTCVDIFAPGVSVRSASSSSNSATTTMSGTSMAAPHVAGAAALVLEVNPSATPAQVGDNLTGNASTNKVSSPGSGTPNRLLYMAHLNDSEPPPPPPPPSDEPPVAAFSFSCTALTCSFSDNSTDPNNDITSRAWTFGDGGSSTAANPSHTYGASGTYTVTLTVTDSKGASDSASTSVQVTDDPDPSTPTLASGQAHSDSISGSGSWRYYKIAVPAGRSSLSASISTNQSCSFLFGCSPDLDLYVRRGAKPTTSAYDCRGYTNSSDESCSVSGPAADWYYIGVRVYSGSGSLSYSVTATY